MLRIILETVALLITPAVLCVIWTVYIRGTAATISEALSGKRLVLLFFAGVVAVFLGLILARSRIEMPAGTAYEPPSYKDGKIVPGHIK
jgi:hypothetical protein